jgi:metallo-beta-lactamase family protein
MIKNYSQEKRIDKMEPPKVIMAGSGMFEGGKIKGFLKKYLGNPLNTLLIISFQPEYSIGHKLLDGEKIVEIDGAKVKVRAEISSILSFSSHGDRAFLFNWIEAISKPYPKKIFVVHGEEKSGLSLAESLKGATKADMIVPFYGEKYDIS